MTTTTATNDETLAGLIKSQDHLNVLRHIRIFELREPELVLKHGQAWLNQRGGTGKGNALVRRAALEQVVLAALDLNQSELASKCLDRLKQEEGVAADSIRFRRLLGRCLEASGDAAGADLIYQDLLKETPANASASKRAYCLLKAAAIGDVNVVQAQAALVDYVQRNPTDAAAWYELAQARKGLGDFKSAAYCLEEVILGSTPLDAALHVELAECCATAATSSKSSGGTAELLLQARQHMAQALELDPKHTRAQWGLLQCSNLYLQHLDKPVGKNNNNSKTAPNDPFQHDVAQALLEHAAQALETTYQSTPLEPAVRQLCREFRESVDGDEI